MRRFLCACAVVMSVLEADRSLAQTGADEPSPRPVTTRQDWFSIPFHIAATRQAERKPVEVQLYVSDDAGRSWQLHDRVAPDAGQVSFQAMRDGRYFFCVRTQDRSGHLHPPGEMRPEMIVVVDTTSPQLSLTTRREADGAVVAGWRIEESHLDTNSLQLEYKIGAADWQMLAVDPSSTDGTDGVYSGTATWWPADISQTVTVRATVRDVAGNRADNQSQLASTAEGAHEGVAGNARSAAVERAAEIGRPSDLANDPSTATQETTHGPADRPGERYAMRYGGPARTAPVHVVNNRPAPEAPRGGVVDPVKPAVRDQFATANGPSLTGSEELPAGERPRMVNSLRFELDYEVDSIGPSGIGKVYLWGTQDGGQTWRRMAEDNDNRSPVPVSVEREGLYGFRIVVESGSGLHGRLPKAGDAPEVWIGVDLTAPEVELISAEQGAADQSGLLLISWQAADAQLATRPVSLLIRGRDDGPWAPIASGLPNTGRFAWPLDNRVPDQIELRLEVRDEAGNVEVVESPTAITLDRARPEGRIRGVRSLPAGAEAKRGVILNPYYR